MTWRATWRITHVDEQRRRRLLELPGSTRAAAESLALAMWGPARYLSAIGRRP